ncbi:MAG: T9SS type A sorting domain-containing protein [Bacteroidota bacterium]
MKTLFFLFVLMLPWMTGANAQACLPEGITFTIQEQIDHFQANYPGCSEIEGNVTISGNDIINLTGLNGLTTIGGNLGIEGNDALTSLSGLHYVTSIAGDLLISSNYVLDNINGLENVNSIGGNLGFNWNAALSGLSGLENLTSIGGYLAIQNNDALTSLSGLDNLFTIGDFFSIADNSNLTCLSGLVNLSSIGEGLFINWNAALTSLSGLNNLTSIGGYLYIYWNSVLTSLSGLGNIDASSILDLSIYNNASLSTCEVQSICDYLSSPNGTVGISNNAPGCNSPEEVEAACDEVSIESIGFEDDYLLFPNPAGKTVTISGNNATAIREIVIYNQTGQKVLQGKPVTSTLDISKLHPGMYIVELVPDQGKVRKKLMVE